jgi:hypothetical protein
MSTIVVAFLLGAVPNFMFAYGTGIAIKSKSPMPAWAYIIGGFAAYAAGIFLARRAV